MLLDTYCEEFAVFKVRSRTIFDLKLPTLLVDEILYYVRSTLLTITLAAPSFTSISYTDVISKQ